MADSLKDKIKQLYNQLQSEIDDKADLSVLSGYVAKNELPGYLRYTIKAKSISGNAVTVEDRTVNKVVVNSSQASLAVNFPPAITGKSRDFYIRFELGSGVTITNLNFPQGVTFENGDGEMPEVAEGTTLLYFAETDEDKFLVKGEVLTATT